MSKEQSPPVREVVPFKSGKRQSTFRRINIDFAGTALEQALAEKDRLEKASHQSSSENSVPDASTVNDPVDGSKAPSSSISQYIAPHFEEPFTFSASSEKRNVTSFNRTPNEVPATDPTIDQGQTIVEASAVSPSVSPQPSTPNQYSSTQRVFKDGPDSSALHEIKSNEAQISLPSSFEQLELRWKAVLRRAELSVLKALYEMIYAQGLTELLTSPAQISVRAGIDKRHCQRVIAKFEMLGLIEKGETFNTKTKKGTVYHLHLVPHFSPSSTPRVFHFEDENHHLDD